MSDRDEQRSSFRAITIKDIGDRLGMSHSTVSRALRGNERISEETRARVQAAAAELGYVPNLPARTMRGDAPPTLGLAIPEIRNDLYSRIAKAFADSCRSLNCRMLLVLTDDDPEREYAEIRSLAESRVAGMAVTLTGAPLAATTELLMQVPTIQIVRHHEALDRPAICLEEQAGCEQAVDYLVSNGHRHIAYIGTDRRVSSGRDRIEGYLAGHQRRIIPPMSGGMELGPPLESFGQEAVQRLLALSVRPTALIIATSQLIVGAMTALRDAKVQIPSQMSVVGYGNAEWYALTNPPLTTVALPVEGVAQAAALRLHGAICGKNGAYEFPAIMPILTLRESVAPLG